MNNDTIVDFPWGDGFWEAMNKATKNLGNQWGREIWSASR